MFNDAAFDSNLVTAEAIAYGIAGAYRMNMDSPIEVTPEPTDPKQQINPTYSPQTGLFIPLSLF